MSGRFKDFFLMTVVAVASAGLFWLLREHWGHALGLTPYLLFMAWPIMHFYMHRGHGQHHPSDQR